MERLTGPIQHYAWGSTSEIPALLGVPADGQPWAELWLGAHPSAPAQLASGGLDAAITADPGIVGQDSVDRFGPRLPYLMKVLAAAQPLSLQAHPSRSRAEEGFAAEEAAGVPREASTRNYRDDWPKPEVLCALGDFEALYGFADPEQVAENFDRLAVAGLADLVAPLRGANGIRTVFTRLCRLTSARELVADVVTAAAASASEPSPYGKWCATAVELNEHHRGDPGVIAALLMNRMSLSAGEAIYLPAGNLHAYLSGLGVEIMANSDNVLRGGLTGKHVDVGELEAVLDFSPVAPEVIGHDEVAPGLFCYRTPAPEFRLWRIELSGSIELPDTAFGRVVLVSAGVVSTEPLELRHGESAWAPAGETVTLTGEGHVFVGSPGLDSAR